MTPKESRKWFEENVIKAYSFWQIDSLLSMVSPREEKILRFRFGIERRQTLQEIAESFGLTRERIRQLEYHAIEKIREAF